MPETTQQLENRRKTVDFGWWGGGISKRLRAAGFALLDGLSLNQLLTV
jgi:hypothetical protein